MHINLKFHICIVYTYRYTANHTYVERGKCNCELGYKPKHEIRKFIKKYTISQTLDNGIHNIGTHWAHCKKINNNFYYFVSLGNLRPQWNLSETFLVVYFTTTYNIRPVKYHQCGWVDHQVWFISV